MNKASTILNELKELSPAVAAINRQLPYQVPAGYFDTLADTINTRIVNGASLPETGKENPYQAPEGYFDSLAANIMNRIKATEAGSPREELSFLSPVLNNLDKKFPFSNPVEYFEELPENVVAGIKAVDFVNEELENLSPLMNGLKGKQVYEVPANYFDIVPGIVLDRIKQQNALVVVVDFRKRMFRYAAAAVVIGIMAWGAWMYSGKPAEIKPIVKNSPVLTPDSVSSELVKTLSDSDLVSLADNPVFSATETTDIALDEWTTGDTNELLGDLSDEVLEQYLDQQAENNTSIIN
jgi:hypothetical protein